MSADIDESGPSKRILVIVASPTKHPTLGYPVGFWASELTHAWYELVGAGYEVTIASPAGGRVEIDAYSDPRDPSGYSADDILSLGFLTSAKHSAMLDSTRKLSDCAVDEFDAIYVAGGQAPMFTFRDDGVLIELVRKFYEAGKITALVCHGTCVLLDVKLSDGRLLIDGKRMTGFANSEEDYADKVTGAKVMPFRIEDEAKKRGATFVAAPMFESHAVRDGNLITGQQQHSGREAARLVIATLGR
jgi:putative intracellular protease/amidase